MQVEKEYEQDAERQRRNGGHHAASTGSAHVFDGLVQHAVRHRGEQIEVALRQHCAVNAPVLPDVVLVCMDDMQHVAFVMPDGVLEFAYLDVDGRVRRRHMELHVVIGGVSDALTVANEI